MSGPLPWQYTEAQKDAQLPYLPSVLQAAPGRLDALEGSVDGALSRLDAVEGQVGALDGRLDAVESQGSALDGRVDALEASQVTELDDLSDVALTSPVSGDNLYHDGTGWKNRTAAAAPWALKTGTTFTGDVGVSGNKSLIMSQVAFFNLTRTLPSAAGDYVELGDLTNTNFAANLELWLNVHNGGYSQSKRYFMPLSYNATAGTWQKALPISTTGAYSGYDTDLEIRVTNLVASLRLRRTSGFFPNAAADVVLLLGGSADETPWTPTTGTGTGAAPTAYYQVRAEGFNAEFLGAGVGAIPFTNRPLLQAGNVPVQLGLYSLSSWAGTGVRVPVFASCPSHNGGATPAAAQVVAVFAREGVAGVAYANFAEIKLRRVSHVGVEARTGMTIALTHGANASAGTDVLDLKSDGTVAVPGSLLLGAGTALTKAVVYTPTLTPASQGANTLVEQTFTVAGLTPADTVYVNAPGAVAMSARVSAADTLALTFHAPSGGTYTAPAGVYRIVAIRS